MNQDKEKWLTPELTDSRNKIIGEYLDYSFDEALRELDQKFAVETEFSDLLTLMAARSWLIKNKVHALIHEPFAFSVGDLEGLDISPTIKDDDDSDSLAASLFGDDDDDDFEVEVPKISKKKVAAKKVKKNSIKTDDEKEKKMVEISILKNISLNGVKLLKDMVLEVSSADAGKLVAENKARIIE
ncbi:MAG: hypothetical protein P8L40_08450 [Planktomarina sp.]|nr:hypothetical protein [Planktomarina sp.]